MRKIRQYVVNFSILLINHFISSCTSATSPLLASCRQACQVCTSHVLPMAFTASRLEKEERKRGAGLWVDDEDFQLHEDFNDSDYEFEELEDDDDEELIPENSKPRLKVYSSDSQSNIASREDWDEEHPMRTDEWLVNVKLSPMLLPGNSESVLFPNSSVDGDISHLKLRRKSRRKKQQILKFAKNGYVQLVESSVTADSNQKDDAEQNDRVTKIGKWKFDTSGVSWSIPVHMKSPDSQSRRTTLHYHADIHLSKFQDQPRMIRGVVTRDHFNDWSLPIPFMRKFEKNLFRPVIATFTGQGVGHDTVDISYKNRGFGLASDKSKTQGIDN
jgi:hypothetical protein